MGRLKNGINGPIVGKVGTVVGSSWRGIDYVKSLPKRKKPPTENEKINRFIFAKTQNWLQPIAGFLKVGFKNYTHTNQGVNAAKSYLYKNALIKDGYDSVIDPAEMKVSYGNLPLVEDLTMELNNENELRITWKADAVRSEEKEPDDQVMILAYNVDKEDAYYTVSGQFRKTGSDKLDLKLVLDGTIHVYVAFVSVDRSRQSNSVYLGTVFTEKKQTGNIVIKKKEEKATEEKQEASDNQEISDNKTASANEQKPENEASENEKRSGTEPPLAETAKTDQRAQELPDEQILPEQLQHKKPRAFFINASKNIPENNFETKNNTFKDQDRDNNNFKDSDNQTISKLNNEQQDLKIDPPE